MDVLQLGIIFRVNLNRYLRNVTLKCFQQIYSHLTRCVFLFARMVSENLTYVCYRAMQIFREADIQGSW